MAPSTCERDTLRAVSSTLTWSAAMADSYGLWSSEKSGVAVSVPLPGSALRWRWRYSSRAASCSSGKPSKPSACEKRTTVEEEVFARLASSSAVWKAASSRWSTMYWATSFCERENSSKRATMYADRVWWAPGAPGRSAAGVVVARFMASGTFDGRSARSFLGYPAGSHEAHADTARGVRGARARRLRGRTRLLRRDLPRGRVGE